MCMNSSLKKIKVKPTVSSLEIWEERENKAKLMEQPQRFLPSSLE